ncbi:MAG: DUF488 domain-containing protein [Deltaproteobacteria bacterium]|nr:DUF488 domain-containing protein [Deltaproteobacteria bacterium]
MEIYTIGFTQKSAAEFFETLKQAGIKRLVDIRLNNQSQLAGFTKQADLQYFLEKICRIEYIYEPLLAPSREMVEGYRKRELSWEDYESQFIKLMEERQITKHIKKLFFKKRTVLLCSEPRPDQCHRRLVAEFFMRRWGDVSILHL